MNSASLSPPSTPHPFVRMRCCLDASSGSISLSLPKFRSFRLRRPSVVAVVAAAAARARDRSLTAFTAGGAYRSSQVGGGAAPWPGGDCDDVIVALSLSEDRQTMSTVPRVVHSSYNETHPFMYGLRGCCGGWICCRNGFC